MVLISCRSLQRTRSLSLQSTPSLATPTSVNRPLHFDLYHTMSSKSSLSLLAATPPRDRPHPYIATPLHGRPHSSANPTVISVLKQMSRLLDWRECMCYVHVTCMFMLHTYPCHMHMYFVHTCSLLSWRCLG